MTPRETRKFSPKYLNVSAHQFGQSVINVARANHQALPKCFKRVPVLHFYQRYARLLDKVCHLKLEQTYWNCVAETLLDAMTWLSRMPKGLNRRDSIIWEYPKTEKNIRKRQQTMLNQRQRAQDDLDAHAQEENWPCELAEGGSTYNHIVISLAVETLVQQGLRSVETNFEQKKILLDIDSKEVQLVRSLYDLNPTEEQVCHYLSYTERFVCLFVF